MIKKHNKALVPFAKRLRREMTKEERKLWFDFLRTYPLRFIRQKIIGIYIVDFYCTKAKLVIELDGSQHYEDRIQAKDLERADFLSNFGLKVIRIPNNQINLKFKEVCEYIDIVIKQSLSQ